MIIWNDYIPFKGYKIFNFFGILFVRNGMTVTAGDISHERIHNAQMREMLWVFFYLWYAVEYIIIRCFHKRQNGAYRDVSFEEEAHNNERDLDYWQHRKHYAWVKYLKVRSNG